MLHQHLLCSVVHRSTIGQVLRLFRECQFFHLLQQHRHLTQWGPVITVQQAGQHWCVTPEFPDPLFVEWINPHGSPSLLNIGVRFCATSFRACREQHRGFSNTVGLEKPCEVERVSCLVQRIQRLFPAIGTAFGPAPKRRGMRQSSADAIKYSASISNVDLPRPLSASNSTLSDTAKWPRSSCSTSTSLSGTGTSGGSYFSGLLGRGSDSDDRTYGGQVVFNRSTDRSTNFRLTVCVIRAFPDACR
jgi:hypothetical protein